MTWRNDIIAIKHIAAYVLVLPAIERSCLRKGRPVAFAVIADMLGSGDPPDALKSHAEELEHAAKVAEACYTAAQQYVSAFAQAAFAGDSFQVQLCRDVLSK